MTPDFAGLTVGDVIAERRFTLNRESLVRYAGASGDFNPIHYRDDVAQKLGLPSVLAHGMLTMGLAIQPVLDWVGAPERLRDYAVRFTRPVLVDAIRGAEVTVTAAVGLLDAQTQTARIDLTVVASDSKVLGKAQAFVNLS
jgi:acyl dehydratase